MTSYIVNTGVDVSRYDSSTSFPTSAPNGALAIALNTGFVYEFNASTPGWQAVGGGGGSGAVWGMITGTLSDQMDLEAALDAKAPLLTPVFQTSVEIDRTTTGDATLILKHPDEDAGASLATLSLLRSNGDMLLTTAPVVGGDIVLKPLGTEALRVSSNIVKMPVSSSINTGSDQMIVFSPGLVRIGAAVVLSPNDDDDANLGGDNTGDLTMNRWKNVTISRNACIYGGIKLGAGSNRSFGVATLTAGSVTVANTLTVASTSTQIIMLTPQAAGGVPGVLAIANKVAGTSFDIVSSNIADTSTVAYMIVSAAP